MAPPKVLRPGYYLRRPTRFVYLFLVVILSLWITVEYHSKSDQIKNLTEKIHRMEDVTEKLSLKVSKMTQASFGSGLSEKTLKRKKNTLILGLNSDKDFYEDNNIQLDRSAGAVNDKLDALENSIENNKNPSLVFPIKRNLKKIFRGNTDEKSRSSSSGSRKFLNSNQREQDKINRIRQGAIKSGMQFAFNSYERLAWGFDELQPQSRAGVNHFGGLGATIIDSLDTLYIMGLNDEFDRAKKWIVDKLDFNKNYVASVFETIIRCLGGLISAYDLSNQIIFLEKAKSLGERLLPAWNTEHGLPYSMLNLQTGAGHSHSWTGGSSILADMGTTTIEMISLSQRLNDSKYANIAERVISHLGTISDDKGLIPIYISLDSGRPTNSLVTFGAMGDSYYEYLLKAWLLGGKTNRVSHYREMWEKSMIGLKTLVKYTSPSNLAFIAESHGGSLRNKMDHLACFVPGMLVLGSGENGVDYVPLAKDLMRTCYEFYNSTASKLSGENYVFQEQEEMHVGYGAEWYILRPEVVESLFYLWRNTKDNIYREWGWNIWQAIERNCKLDSGFTGLRNVNMNPPEKDDMMQSFFLAETLKYLYLLFSPDDVIPLDQWVFNTEAHPIRIIPRT